MRIDATKHYRFFDKNSMIFKPYLKFQKLELSRTTRSYLKTFSLVLPTCVTFRGQHLNIKIDNSCFSEYSISHCQEISKTNSSLKEQNKISSTITYRSFDRIDRLFVIENQVCNSIHKFRVGFCKVDHKASLSRIHRCL